MEKITDLSQPNSSVIRCQPKKSCNIHFSWQRKVNKRLGQNKKLIDQILIDHQQTTGSACTLHNYHIYVMSMSGLWFTPVVLIDKTLSIEC